MNHLWLDLRVGARALMARPLFSIAAIACIAVGIGANTTIFSLVNGLLLRPLPGISDAAPILEIGRSSDFGLDTFSYPVLDSLRRSATTVDVAGWNLVPAAVADGDVATAVLALQVTDNYFDVLGVVPAMGRTFTAEEARPGGGATVAVLSDSLWRRQFDADPEILGRELRLNGAPVTVIGVTPPGFGGTWSVLRVDVFAPLGLKATGMVDADVADGWANHFILSVGRLRAGADAAQAQAELDLLMGQLVAAHQDTIAGEEVGVAQLSALPSPILAGVRLFLGVLMAVVGLVLLVACVNVAGMLLAAAAGRRREIAVRLVLGASRPRLAQQLLTETLLLFVTGGLLGLALASVAARLLLAFDPPLPPPFDLQIDMAFDLRVLAFSLLVTLGTAVVFGLAPALRASRPDLMPALKDEPERVGRLRGRSVLVGAQVAFTVLLVVVSALFLRALDRAAGVALGFDPDRVYTLGIDTDLAGVERDEGLQILRELRAGISRLPGVESVGMVRVLPLGLPERLGLGGVSVAGFEPPEGRRSFDADANVVTPGYFETLGLPLLAGRGIEDDDAGGPRVAVINAQMARRFWDSPAGAVGQVFELESDPVTVVGVAADAKYSALLGVTPLFLYVPVDQRYMSAMNLLVRVRGDTAVTLAEVRATVTATAPDLPLLDVMALREYVEVAYLPQRVAASVAGLLGVVAMLLAATGIYGVTAQVASSRLREVGIRMAVGADRRDVVRLLLRKGMLPPAIGLAVGVTAAALVSGVLESLLFGLSPLDPVAFGVGIVGLAVVSLLANLGPARWASRVDPVRVLREE